MNVKDRKRRAANCMSRHENIVFSRGQDRVSLWIYWCERLATHVRLPGWAMGCIGTAVNEQRRAKRFPIRVPLQIVSEDRETVARTQDISASGILLSTEHLFPAG